MARKGRAARVLWWILGGLAALLILVVLAVQLMSWNFLKPMIAERVEAATGRQLALEGDLSLNLFPRPHAVARQVALENASWASEPRMLELERVKVAPSIGALLRGRIELVEIRILNPRIWLERRPDGAANWQLEAATPQEPAGDGANRPVIVRDLEILGAGISYRGPEAEEALLVEIPSTRLRDDGEALDAQLVAQIRDRAFRLEASGSSLESYWDEADRFESRVRLSADGAHGTLEALLPESPSMEGLEARWEMAVASLQDWTAWAGVSPVDLKNARFAGRVSQSELGWMLEEVVVRIEDTQILGVFEVQTTRKPLRIVGQIRSPEVNLAKLSQAQQDDSEDPTDLSELEVPVLPELEAHLRVAIDRIDLDQLALGDFQAQLVMADHRAAVESMRFRVGGGEVLGSAGLRSAPEYVEAEAQLQVKSVNLEEIETTAALGGIVDLDLAFQVERLDQGSQLTAAALLDRLRIERSDLHYDNSRLATQAQGTLELVGEAAQPRVRLVGQVAGRSFQAEASGDSLTQLVNPDSEYKVAAQAGSGGIEARMNTRLESLQDMEQLALSVELRGEEGADLDILAGRDLPPLPGFEAQAQLRRDGTEWLAQVVAMSMGESQLSGEVRFSNEDRPRLEADVKADRLNLAQLLKNFAPQEESEEQDSAPPGLIESASSDELTSLRSFDARLSFHADELALPSGVELSEVHVVMQLEQGRLTLEPARAGVGGGEVEIRLALDTREAPAAGRVELSMSQVRLASIASTFTPVEDRLGTLSGQLALEVAQADEALMDDEVFLPFIGRLRFGPSTLEFEEEESGSHGSIRFETRHGGDGEELFVVEGDGRYDGSPFLLRMTSDALLLARDAERPFHVEMELEAVESVLTLNGSLLDPLALKGLDLQLAMEGPTPKRLSQLAGLPLPDLPPYSVKGDLTWSGGRWGLASIQGRVGDSDLGGELWLDAQDTSPKLEGELFSEVLDFDDLGGLVGATPAAGEDETVSQEQVQRVEEARDAPTVLPDTPIIGKTLGIMDANVSYRASEVRAGRLPFNKVSIAFTAEDGLIQVDPVGFGVGNGRIDVTLQLDVREEIPKGGLSLQVSEVDLGEALAQWELASESVGVISGGGMVWVQGASIAEIMASADGGFLMLMTGGQLDSLLVELAGLDAGGVLLAWLQDQDAVPIDCSYADLQLRSGLLRVDTFVVDTADTVFAAGGEFDFNDESLDLTLAAYPKDPSLPVGRTPFHIGGTLKDIQPGVHGGQLAARLGGSAALAVAGGPLAAIIPLLDWGPGEDLGICGGLISRLERSLNQKEGEG